MFKEKLLNWLNTFLIANVFLVLLSFAWLAIAVVGHSAGVNLGLELWYSLWQPLFSPAVSILFGAAIVSGTSNWILKKIEARSKTS
jgi:hypothetical protein